MKGGCVWSYLVYLPIKLIRIADMNIETKRLLYALYFPLSFLLLLWAIELIGFQYDLGFEKYGIYPRDVQRISGILFEPVIHADFQHLWSNTIPIFLLLWSLFYFYSEICLRVFGQLWLLSGILTWVIGRPAYHIGASGLIYGVAFFLFFSGVIRRRRSLMALSAIIAFVYGGIVWNMFPIAELLSPETSWEGHLSGAISGALLAYWHRKQGPQRDDIFIEDSLDTAEEEDNYWEEDDIDNTETGK